jgi:hypothetical protein
MTTTSSSSSGATLPPPPREEDEDAAAAKTEAAAAAGGGCRRPYDARPAAAEASEADRAAKKLDRINEVLDYREMPPKKYTLIHADARLTEAQRKEIMDWTDAAAEKMRPAATNQ